MNDLPADKMGMLGLIFLNSDGYLKKYNKADYLLSLFPKWVP